MNAYANDLSRVLALLVLSLLAAPVLAKDPVFTADGGAIRGYDPVAYHEQREPVKGSADYTLQWQSATWYFASAENRDRFRQDPERYAPQYGGYCAFAVANGTTATIDPEAWSIVEGKLYLNYSHKVHERWLQDVPGYIEAANENWPDVLN